MAMNSDRNDKKPKTAQMYSRLVKEVSSFLCKNIFPLVIGESKSPMDAEKLPTATRAAI